MPEGGSVDDHVVGGDTDEKSVDKFRHLNRQQRQFVAVVIDGFVVVEKRLNDQRNIGGFKNIRDSQIDGGVDESCSGAVFGVQEDDQQRCVLLFDGG